VTPIQVDAKFWTDLEREAFTKLDFRKKILRRDDPRPSPNGHERASIVWFRMALPKAFGGRRKSGPGVFENLLEVG